MNRESARLGRPAWYARAGFHRAGPGGELRAESRRVQPPACGRKLS